MRDFTLIVLGGVIGWASLFIAKNPQSAQESFTVVYQDDCYADEHGTLEIKRLSIKDLEGM